MYCRLTTATPDTSKDTYYGPGTLVQAVFLREFDSHGLQIYVFRACALETVWMLSLIHI